MIVPVLLMALASFVLSVALTWTVRGLGRRHALMDSPGAAGQTKVRRRVPNIGGVAIFWSIAVPMLAGLAFVWAMPIDVQYWFPALERHLPGLREQTPMALGLIGALAVLHALGLYDDRRPMPAMPKFVLLFGVATAVCVLSDSRLLTMLDGYAGGAWLSIALTVLWMVAITNAMNFMDNMDGLAAGVGAIASGLLLVTALLHGQWFVASTLSLLVGALCGFLVFNAPRPGGATIFMGDGGSLVLGFMLAFLTTRTTYLLPARWPIVQTDGQMHHVWLSGSGWFAVCTPLCVLAIPLYDLVSVVLIRLSQRRSPFVGDRQHFSHRLLAAGLSVPRTLAVICGCTAITGVSGIMLSVALGWQAALIGVQVLLVLGVIALYEHGKGWPHTRANPTSDRPERDEPA